MQEPHANTGGEQGLTTLPWSLEACEYAAQGRQSKTGPSNNSLQEEAKEDGNYHAGTSSQEFSSVIKPQGLSIVPERPTELSENIF
jgi:hypothetical protein